MLELLPIELVGEVMRTASEIFLERDRATVLNIAKSCILGYNSATPVLYRTVVLSDGHDLLVHIFVDEDTSTTGILAAAPARRLLPLVKRLFLDHRGNLNKAQFRHLVNLEAIFTISVDVTFLDDSLWQILPSTVTQFYALSLPYPESLPLSTTHLSCYFFFGSVADFQQWVSSTVPDSITHVALELNDALTEDSRDDHESGILKLLLFLLARNTHAPVVLRPYKMATDLVSQRVILRAISAISYEDRSRVWMWRDMRLITNFAGDVAASRADSIAGRSPWTEGMPATEEELKEGRYMI